MKICIDAGHNHSGWNTGASGCGLREQDISWQISDKLRALLVKNGAATVMTRPTSETNLGTNNASSLAARYTAANSSGCDVFISIHCNAGGGSGTETLIYAPGGTAERLALLIQKNITRSVGTRDRGVKARPDLAVLKHTAMPAVLVETAFIDDPSDAEKLLTRQDDIAQAICNAVVTCFDTDKTDTGETPRERAERIVRERCDTPDMWIDYIDKIPYMAEFICKIYG